MSLPADAAPARRGRRKGDRGEVILAAASRLFSERGFRAVSIDEIGAASGITGPGIYRHFANKDAVLVRLFDDVCERLVEGARTIAASERDPRKALQALVRFHGDFSLDDRALIATYSREEWNLPDDDRHRIRRLMRAYAEDWVKTLRRAMPELGYEQARARVHAAFGLLHSNAEYHGNLPREEAFALLTRMAMAALLTR